MKENSYVVVCYDNQYYPGIIVELDGDDVRVKTMVRRDPQDGNGQQPDDVIWYSRSDLMEVIEQPNFAAANKRVVFTFLRCRRLNIPLLSRCKPFQVPVSLFGTSKCQ
ncbi:hypothetical protein JTB14_025709 [Gonioctena quinquepunctata]|nr:hypothetical protein JTB14_025709 [Gonioctena quinquepunctata]